MSSGTPVHPCPSQTSRARGQITNETPNHRSALRSAAGGALAIVTVILARVLLAERWTRPQIVGLLAAATAIVLISVS